MGRAHRDAILAALPPGGKMLEWGCGGSTCYFADHLPEGASLLSIEHDGAWHRQVADTIGPVPNLRLRHIPAEGLLGRSATTEEEDPRPLQRYIHAADGETFDVILVDGCARGACLAHARSLLKSGGTVFLHDAQRPWYDDAKLACGLTPWGAIGSCPDDPTAHLWFGGREALPPRPARGGELPVIVSFFTLGTLCEQGAQNLIDSCRALGLDHEVFGVPTPGSWEENCSFKARFISEAWYRHGRPILWVDADAVIRRIPTDLAGIDADFAVHRHEGWQFAGGAIYFNQTPDAEDLLARWRRRCLESPRVCDQTTLDLAWEEACRDRPLRTVWLPGSYATASDHPGGDHAPVIEQLRAPRRPMAATSSSVRGADQHSHPTVKPARLAARIRTADELAAADTELASLREQVAHLAARAGTLHRRLIEAVAEHCDGAGLRRIALFGAGRHTLPIVRQPWNWHDVSVVAILDDHPQVDSLRGVPVMRPEHPTVAFDAVVVSSDAHEPAIYARAMEVFAPQGIPVLRIYGENAACETPAATRQRLTTRWGLSEADARWLADNRAERHDATLPMLPPERTELHLRRYELALPHAAGKRIVDCACGTGYGADMMLSQGAAAAVLGLDVDPRSVDYATRRFGRVGLTFRTAGATATGLADGWADVVTSFETIEHVEDIAAAVDEFARILSPRGTLILSTPNDWGKTDHHVHSFTPDSLAAALAPRFTDLQWLGQRTAGIPAAAEPRAGIEPLTPDSPRPETLLVIARRR